ncbi:hypothetical protein DLAC_09733 [Tieghemostelium lacteum]|uniref:NAD-dependent epimerase/dehydratase domain-containing protein n=1 Tax=Tieghemostelium lacteum TaxID=361077 RepID=A0A151Z7K3_TIELA|nr:hypothetical protein DLAC_09733 [Tieghemostelium lacteum]|eukprot:KYQ89764.1 hypothetical protein DLAC_09733 [Tieghemostelium lacteum]
MKLIIFGATGFSGSHFLKQALLNQKIEKVLCLTRRELQVKNDKLINIVHNDFTKYDNDMIEKMVTDYDGCLWAIGGKHLDFKTLEEHFKVSHTMVYEFVKMIEPVIQKQSKVFSFLYLSGKYADQSESAYYYLLGPTRNVKGKTEKELTQVQQRLPNLFTLSILRPAGIVESKWLPKILPSQAVHVDTLANVALDLISSNNLYTTKIYEQNDIINYFK